MADDTATVHSPSLADLYLDTLWNLHASCGILVAKLPTMAAMVSHPQLATALRDGLGVASHHRDVLETMVSRSGQPARVHAAEMEALLGEAARQFGGWFSGDARDLAVCAVARTALHLTMPTCELAAGLAATLRYDQDIDRLSRLRMDMDAADYELRQIARARLAAHAAVAIRPPESAPARATSIEASP